MVVGVIVWQLHLAGSQSLKDKRRVVKSLKDRLHQRFHVSAAEVNHQDLWQRAALAASVVSADGAHAAEVLASCARLVEREPEATILESETSFY